jgi:hypothetical protein
MIRINGEIWRVRLVPPSHPILTTRGGNPAIGCCDDITKTIYVSNALNPYKIKKVLCHEIAHAAMYSYDVNISDYTEEIVADLISTYGNEIIYLTDM